jgi:hypothetical protein
VDIVLLPGPEHLKEALHEKLDKKVICDIAVGMYALLAATLSDDVRHRDEGDMKEFFDFHSRRENGGTLLTNRNLPDQRKVIRLRGEHRKNSEVLRGSRGGNNRFLEETRHGRETRSGTRYGR